MGTFLGHILPGLAFTLLGLWHTLNTTKSYKLHGPSTFTSTTWFPFPTIKHLELYLIFSFSILAIALQLFDRPPLSLTSLEHASMFLHLAIYTAAALAADISPSPEALSPLVGALAASTFCQELFLLHFHSADHVGLEGQYHWLLQLIVAASLLAAIAAAGLPTSFAAAVVRSAAVTCQGLWFAVMGFALWVPRLVPEGCYATGLEGKIGAVECRTEDAGRRAVALANLQFSWMIAGVSILTVYLSLRPDWKWMKYMQLEFKGVDVGRSSREGEDSLKQGYASV